MQVDVVVFSFLWAGALIFDFIVTSYAVRTILLYVLNI